MQRAAPVPLVMVLTLLAGCGDDLESRNAAVGASGGQGGQQLTVQSAPRATTQDEEPPAALVEVEPDEEIEADDDVIYDADPESLIDTAQGFSTDPIDSGRGIDPVPMNDVAPDEED